jgi:hypothetical protein
MCVLSNIVALARDHCSNGKGTMSSMRVVELRITIGDKKLIVP